MRAMPWTHFSKSISSATFIGDYRYNDRMANSNGPEYRAAAEAMDREFLARLLEIDREDLGDQDQLSYDIFKINRELSLEGKQYPFHLQPVNQFSSVTNSFVQLGSGTSAHPFNTVKDYEDFLSRADDYSTIIDQVISNMKEGMKAGVTQPRTRTKSAIRSCRPTGVLVISLAMSTTVPRARPLGSMHNRMAPSGTRTWFA